MAELEPRSFLRPCLLLLLRERDDHGYGLAARLQPLHDGDGDAGSVYRALRGMERLGLVRSEWHASAVGPARRTYHITTSGLEFLETQARDLANVHASLHVFMDRYAALTGHERQPAQEGNHDHHPARNGHRAGLPRARDVRAQDRTGRGTRG